MKELEKKEERNKRIGWIAAVAVQLLLLVLFYFLVAWKAPNPPIPEYGIELGFSTSAGATSSTPPLEATDEPVTEEEVQQEVQAAVEEVVASESEESIETEAEAVEEEMVAEDVESPVQVEESEVKPAEVEPVSEEINNSEEEPIEAVNEEVIAKEIVEEKVVEKPIEETDTSEGQGEEMEEPVIDERGIYGSQGTTEGKNEGSSLSLAGWSWDFEPRPDDTSEEVGEITFKIAVDSDGLIVKIEEVIGATVSRAVAIKYRQAVEKLTFSKTLDYEAADRSTGTITFIIKSK